VSTQLLYDLFGIWRRQSVTRGLTPNRNQGPYTDGVGDWVLTLALSLTFRTLPAGKGYLRRAGVWFAMSVDTRALEPLPNRNKKLW
jgi:hypothetical protein